MATPYMGCLFCYAPMQHHPANRGGPRQPPNLPTKGRGRPNTTPRPHNSTRHHPATAQQHLPATCEILQQRKKYCEKCCSFKKISYFCSLKANRKIVKMRCKTTHFLMLTPATAWVGIFIS